jgi:hypothetical protein
MSPKPHAIAVLLLVLTGCPEQQSPSELPKPADPSTDQPGPDTVPARPPSPLPTENPKTPPIHHKDEE